MSTSFASGCDFISPRAELPLRPDSWAAHPPSLRFSATRQHRPAEDVKNFVLHPVLNFGAIGIAIVRAGVMLNNS
jgi:hypothetical protein